MLSFRDEIVINIWRKKIITILPNSNNNVTHEWCLLSLPLKKNKINLI